MDDPNNPNPNNPPAGNTAPFTPTDTSYQNPSTPLDLNPPPNPIPTDTPPIQTDPTSFNPTPAWPPVSSVPNPIPDPQPMPNPTPPPTPPAASTWPQNPTPSYEPIAPNPYPNPVPEPPPLSPTPPPPLPTFPSADTSTSSLDNPLGVPAQPPPLDGPGFYQPPVATTQPEPMAGGESVPTDLSHLIMPNESQEAQSMPTDAVPPAAQEPLTTSETLVAPSQAAEVPTIPTEGGHGGIPKWVIGLGIGLLIVIAGVSAYFILGVGKPPNTASVPATQVPTTQQIKTPPPVVQPTPQQSASTATGSASFGALEGSRQATSAADLLRQRQQQAR